MYNICVQINRPQDIGGSMSYSIKEGNYFTLGATVNKNQITFTFQGEKEDFCCIVLIHKTTGKQEKIEVPEAFCLGSLRSVTVCDIKAEEYVYLYEVNGKEVLDPYAKAVAGREIWNDAGRKEKEFRVYGGFVSDYFSWGEDKQPEITKSEMFMYKLHVRGFSMGNATAGKTKGTFSAVKNKIPYLKELGVTTIELMPVYEFEEMPLLVKVDNDVPDYVKWEPEKEDVIRPLIIDMKEKDERLNFWGYGEGNYFAVKASYAAEPQKASLEFKKLIKALHSQNMECVMEMFFPENTNQNLILDVLRYWVKEYHVDGFHLLGSHIPTMAIVQDAVLSRTKIFMENFGNCECNGRKYKNLYVYREEYQYAARQLLNHYDSDIREFANQQKKQGTEVGFVNYIATNNGYTLADLFMYNDKHNEANGENNCDGPDYNLSNNYGVEGPTRKKFINEIRRNKMRNAFMMLMFAQGVPLIWAGDEFGNSQNGNNNAYCQDNEIGWIDWSQSSKYKKEREFLKRLVEFRKAHSLISNANPYKFNDYRSFGTPDLSYHGEYAWISQLDPGKKSLGMLYAGAYAKEEQDKNDIYIGYNFYSECVKLALPKLAKKKKWYLKMNSANGNESILSTEIELKEQQYVEVAPHSICMLIGK